MATVREGQQAVLLVVDVQVGVMAECWDAARVIGNVARAVDKARAQAVPVVWVQHEDDQLVVRGSAPWQWVPELQPRQGDAHIGKRFNSSFESTELDATLDRLGASHLVLAGAQSNWCIRATAHAALDRGYDLTLVKDAHTTETLDLGPDRRILASSMVDELNVALRWLRYPGRVNQVVGIDALDFAAPAVG